MTSNDKERLIKEIQLLNSVMEELQKLISFYRTQEVQPEVS